MNTLLLLTLFLAASLALQATLLWGVARLCRLQRRSWARAAGITVARLLVSIGLWLVIVGWDGDSTRTEMVMLLAVPVDIAVTVFLMRRMLDDRWLRVLRAWGIQFVAGIIVSVGAVYAIQSCIGAYTASSSSMSPNIRGFHVVENLPDGNHLIVAANDPADPNGIPFGDPSGGIVAETFEYREIPRPASYSAQADRFLCNKTKFPGRWDAVVIHSPRNPSIIYVKRLVGFPGERIVIRDKAVWVNEERQVPPARLGPIRYRGYRPDEDDAAAEEIILGPDDYFVLGDNANKSSDSRDFGPIKRDLIVGVADLIYWPPARWRTRP